MSHTLTRPRAREKLARLAPDLCAVLLLLALVVAFYWRIALTGRVLASGDVFTYFFPYWSEATRALRAGRVPLWNPYLFMGVPFLANSQAGVLYPLNWPLWLALPAYRSVHLAPVLHLGLAAMNTYLLARVSLRVGRIGAWAAGLVFALGGYLGAQLEHVNQVQALAWLPLALLLCDRSVIVRREINRRSVAAFAGFCGVVGTMLLAGHLQAAFISLVGTAVYVLVPTLRESLRERKAMRVARPAALLALAFALGVALAAVQLVPTWELARLSIRAGGLPYRERVSFSLSPFYLARALLPTFFSPVSPAHLEHVVYVGVSGIALVGIAVFGTRLGKRRLLPATVLVALGLFLSLGAYNPMYQVLALYVPGFVHFRVPARWLALSALGVALIAGWGAQTLWEGRFRPTVRALGTILLVVLVLSLWAVLGVRAGEGAVVHWIAPVAWLAALAAVVLLLLASRRSPRWSTAGLLAVLLAELYAAGQTLPHSRATASQAFTSLRPAVAHLQAGQPGRFLSMSDITFDPGDLGEIEVIYGPQLTADELYDYVIATKHKEVQTPNLPLAFGVPAVDGYDGGLLPLARYGMLQELVSPTSRAALDGRLRENLTSIPSGRWLTLFNARYVITDKLRDAWVDDVFYDFQFGADLAEGEDASVAHVPQFRATALGLVSHLRGASDLPDGALVGEAEVSFAGGQTRTFPLFAGEHTAEGVYGPHVAHARGQVGREFQAGQSAGYDYATRLRWDEPDAPTGIKISANLANGELIVHGLSLVDERTGGFQSLVISSEGRFRLVHSGDVKIYENLDTHAGAFLVHDSLPAADDAAAVTALESPGFDPSEVVVLNQPAGAIPDVSDGAVDADCDSASERVELEQVTPERIEIAVVSCAPGYLVLSSAWYPGWEVAVDGEPAPLHRADLLFSAVSVGSGSHAVVYTFRPTTVWMGGAATLVALVCLVILVISALHCPKVRAML